MLCVNGRADNQYKSKENIRGRVGKGMRRKIVFLLCVVCILLLAAVGKEPLGQMLCHTVSSKDEWTISQGNAVCGKGMRYRKVEQTLVSGVNLTKLAKEEKKRAEEKREQYIRECIETMTLDQKLAQMMILTNEKDITGENLETFQPGGIIFFAVDFQGKTVRQVRDRVEELQSYVKVPLFVGVDEEGGKVSRISGLKDDMLPEFKSARKLYEEGGITAVRQETAVKVKLLKQMGINLNFDPVADVVSNSKAYMYERSASADVSEASEYVEAVVSVMHEQDMGCCLKHFPGYGNNANTHQTYASDDKELSVYRQKDFIPFQAGITKGADMVMVSHIVMSKVDEKNPASLSKRVHELLREDLSFSGVVIADDLNMKAILNRMSIKKATAKAFIAGNDMVFSADFKASLQGAVEAVEKGELSEQQVEESVARILRMKMDRELIITEE